MSNAQNDIHKLQIMLRQVIEDMERQLVTLDGSLEGKWLTAAINLSKQTMQMVNNYISGRSTLSLQVIYENAFSDSRGFAEIGSATTQMPGLIRDEIEAIRRFSLERSRATP